MICSYYLLSQSIKSLTKVMVGTDVYASETSMLQLLTQVGNPMLKIIMRSKMIHVLHVPGQEASMSSKSLMTMGRILTTCNHARRLKFGTQAGNPMSRTIMRSRMTHVLHVFG